MKFFISNVPLALAALLLAAPAQAQSACAPGNSSADLHAEASDTFAAGKQCFVFSDWPGPELPVWLYVPTGIDRAQAPIAIIMHGASRDPDRYRDEWAAKAQEYGFIVAAPGFSRADFPGSADYNLGGMRDGETGQWREPDMWSYSAVEPIFDAVKARLGSAQAGYTLYGHSAGSQFVHRTLFFRPGPRAKRFLAANAGWYTFPDTQVAFPFGLGETMIDEAQVRAALAQDVVILLGDQDSDPMDDQLNRSAGAMAQGPHRFARGQAFYAAARALAQSKGWDFGWSLRVVPGVAHSNGGMALQVADLIE